MPHLGTVFSRSTSQKSLAIDDPGGQSTLTHGKDDSTHPGAEIGNAAYAPGIASRGRDREGPALPAEEFWDNLDHGNLIRKGQPQGIDGNSSIA